jgi:hypothetical protein
MTLPTQKFTSRELKWMRRWRSQAHLRTKQGDRPTTHGEWKILLKTISEQISAGVYNFSGLRWHKIGKKFALSSHILEDILVIRKINSNIRRCYSIRESNRSQLIRTARQAMSEPVPKTILRVDLKSCYESIDRNRLIKALKIDSLLSTETLGLVDQLFKTSHRRIKGKLKHGIPRGLILSTSLAEIALKKLDAQLKAQSGTYLVLRYVDDILIFTTKSAECALIKVKDAIKECGFKINESKLRALRVSCDCETACPHGGTCPCLKKCKCAENHPSANYKLDFLGYKLIFSAHNTSAEKKLNTTYCTFSSKKIDRIKHRIWRAIYNTQVDQDWSLLKDRIRYLADNQKLDSQPGRRGLLAGLSYTHSECQSSDPQVKASLLDLDDFYRAALRRRLFGVAPQDEYKALVSLSFSSGFSDKRRTKFSGSRVIQIKKGWSAS